MTFRIYSVDDALESAKGPLKQIQAHMGFLPNIAGVMAGAPPLLEAFVTLERCMKGCSLSKAEQDVVLLTVSAENQSAYCVEAHMSDAHVHGLSREDIEAVKSGKPLSNEKFEALRLYTLAVMENHGRPDDEVINRFLQAGYKPRQALEIVLGITLKTLTNYTWRLAHPPIDGALKEGNAWRKNPERKEHAA